MTNNESISGNDSVQKESGWESVAAMAGKMEQLGLNAENLETGPLEEFATTIGINKSTINKFFKERSKEFADENSGVENPFALQKEEKKVIITSEQKQYYLQEKIDKILIVQKNMQDMLEEQKKILDPPPTGYITKQTLANEFGMKKIDSVRHFFKSRGYKLERYKMPETGSIAEYISEAQADEYREYRKRKDSALGGNEYMYTHSDLIKELNGVKKEVVYKAERKFSDYVFGEEGKRKSDRITTGLTIDQYERLREKTIEFMNDKRRANFPESCMSYYLKTAGVKYERTYRPDWLKNEDTGRNFEIDLYLPEYNIGIEYDGLLGHKDTLEHDFQKDQKALANNGTKIFHVREAGLPDMKDGMLGVKREKNYGRASLSAALTELFAKIGINSPQGIDVKRDADEIDKVVLERLNYLNYGANSTLAIADNVSDIQLVDQSFGKMSA